ncbi:MAG: hypothetical protein H5T85_08940, partial [Actinobacteria bacterium]|nr:hypothetical protein [Actinomycetota bacterium]
MKLVKLKTGDKKNQTEDSKTLEGLRSIKEDSDCGETEVIADDLFLANTFFKRLSGLIFRKKLKDREGIVIENC